MDGRLILAIVTITLALVFYSVGVWSERRSKSLKLWHVLCFWGGLLFDMTGTTTMMFIADSGAEQAAAPTALVHGVSGAIAIALMILHAVWATIVLRGNDEKKKQGFHRFSIVVWAIWLIPYFVGMFLGMA